MNARRGSTDLSGVLAIDKPAGMTSHDVVAILRSVTGERRVGHAGTLDPAATGLLVVLVGSATRLERYISGHDKRYEARIAFGAGTDTLDADGEVVETAEVPASILTREFAAPLLDRFLGASAQLPPAYSAIKLNGVPSHRRARAGEDPVLSLRPIVVHEATLRGIDPVDRTWEVAFHVSKGTYIRSLARDIGVAAGTVAHLSALRRTHIGSLEVFGALALDDVRALGETGTLADRFIDPVPLLDMSSVPVDPAAVADGRPMTPVAAPPPDGAPVALVTDDRLLAVYRTSDGILLAETVFGAGVAR